MLSIRPSKHSRRSFLTAGTLGLGSWALTDLLRARSMAPSLIRNKSVVLLFLGGGPPQHETFDPKMDAPRGYRAMFGETQTSLAGVTFGSHFTGLAKHADKLAIVRCFRNGMTSHGTATAYMAAGGNPTKAHLANLYSRIAGTINPTTGIPNNVMLGPRAAGADFVGSPDYTARLNPVNQLGSNWGPFDPSGAGNLQSDMTLGIASPRFDDRRALLRQLDTLKRNLHNQQTLEGADQFTQQAFDVLLKGVARSFDLTDESPATLDRYDTHEFEIPSSVFKKKPNKAGFENQTPVFLGRQMLLARRMVEAGCGFVTVTSTGWDLHGNRFGVDDGIPCLGGAVDKAVTAFLEDLQQRGMSDDVLLVITGEFGRTPRINNKAGRDHWGGICPLLLAGGGLNMGQVIGQSDKTGGKPISEPVTTAQLTSTILHTLVDPGEVRLLPEIPQAIQDTLSRAEPIRQL
ncbi:MAG: DUF1501 domain-containing protein [Planctomycetota bacterium]|nr:DUF1501 domain-containing protein [Planctomycetota bacterium]